MFFSRTLTNVITFFPPHLRFLSLHIQPEHFQLHTRSKGSWAVSHTASSTKVRVTEYLTTALSPNSFLRIVTSSNFVFDLLRYGQKEFVLFLYMYPCEFPRGTANTPVSCFTEWTRTLFPSFLHPLEFFPLPVRRKALHMRSNLAPAQAFALSLSAKKEMLWSWALLVVLHPGISISSILQPAGSKPRSVDGTVFNIWRLPDTVCSVSSWAGRMPAGWRIRLSSCGCKTAWRMPPGYCRGLGRERWHRSHGSETLCPVINTFYHLWF